MGVAAWGGGFAWDLLCDLYQVFFADMVGEFLRSVVAEHVKLSAPMLAADAEGRIADWVAEKVVDLVPNPCEESAAAAEPAQAADTAQSAVGAVRDPAAALPGIAKSLVPRAVGKVLARTTAMAARPVHPHGCPHRYAAAPGRGPGGCLRLDRTRAEGAGAAA